MKHKWMGIAPAALLLTGCAALDAQKVFEVKGEQQLPSEYVNLLEDVVYPVVATDFVKISAGSQILLTANTLADKLGVEFVEWNYSLNPYEYSHKRNLLVDLYYQEPQESFLKLFSGTGLLPYYDEKQNTIYVHPYKLGVGNVNQPTIFTPLFEQAQKHVEDAKQSEKHRISKDWFKYFGYEGYTIKNTVNAWAQHAGYSSVVWFVQKPHHRQFLTTNLVKDDFYVGAVPSDAIESILHAELERQKKGFSLNVSYEEETNRLIVHPFRSEENIESFEIEPTSVKANISRLAEKYDYELEYLATDYGISTPYVTVVGDYFQSAVEVVADEYPLKVEVIESTRIIKVRNK